MIFLANPTQIRNGITKLFAESGKPDSSRKTELTKKCPAISDGAKGTFCNGRFNAIELRRQFI